MTKEMLINVSEGEETRIALLEDGRLEELYMERTSSTSHVGNIYKGRVTNVEASIQAAFVDFGLGRNGFLHISDLMPTYFGRRGEDIVETVGKKMARRDRPPIQRCLRRGDEIIVQIIKEGIGTKGPTLSTYLSIPGRILVMMPGLEKMGVSRKIEDDEERRRLRGILDSVKPPEGVGFIIRTAGIGKSKTEIQRDLTYLTRLWQTIEKTRQSSPAPVELYTEGDLVTRTVRDMFGADVDRIIVDNKDVAKRVKDVIKLANPRAKNRVELYEDPLPLFHKFNIERDIELMHSRHVPLPSGGSLVIDSTEAVVAIDVNSGKSRESSDAETTAFRTDMEAADEIPRQLRLRDLGGVIICDFIDLRFERHRRELEARLNDHFKHDRAKTKVLRMSQFGIIEMTRQRMRPSLKRSIYFDCPHCKGAGLVKTPESMSLDVMRRLAIALADQRVVRVELTVCSDVAFYLQNRKRRQLADLEDSAEKHVLIRSDSTLGLDEMRLALFDSRDGLVVIEQLASISSTASPASAPPRRGQLPPPRDAGRSNDRRGGSDRGPRAEQQRRPAPNDRRAANDEPFDSEDEERRYDEEPDSSFVDLDDGHEPLGEAPQPIDSDEDRGRSDVDMGDASLDRPRSNRGGDRIDRRPPMNRPPRRDERPAAAIDNRGGPRSGENLDERNQEDRGEGDSDNALPRTGEPAGGREGDDQGDGSPRRRRRRRRGRRGRGANRENGQDRPETGAFPGEQDADAPAAGAIDDREQHEAAIERASDDESDIPDEAEASPARRQDEIIDVAASETDDQEQLFGPTAEESEVIPPPAVTERRLTGPGDEEPREHADPDDDFGNRIDYVQPHERPRQDRANRPGRGNRGGANPRLQNNRIPPRQGPKPDRNPASANNQQPRGGGANRQPRRDGGQGAGRNERNQNRDNRGDGGSAPANPRDGGQRYPDDNRRDQRSQEQPARRDNRGPAQPRLPSNAPSARDDRSRRPDTGPANAYDDDYADPRVDAGVDRYDQKRPADDERFDVPADDAVAQDRAPGDSDAEAAPPLQSAAQGDRGAGEAGSAPSPAAEEDAPPPRRRRRGGRGRGRKAAATDDAATPLDDNVAAEAPAPSKAASEAPVPARAPVPIPQPPVTRTGSTDRHLISDEPIVPEPVRRPRSYRDLDEIPDDLD